MTTAKNGEATVNGDPAVSHSGDKYEGCPACCTDICPDCAGEGRIQQEKASTICPTCHGTGRV